MRSKILVLDDESNICVFLSMSLEDTYDVYTATTPTQAYKILEKHEIDLALIDLIIGRYNGIDVLRTIREKYLDTSVIMMTAFGNIHSSVEAIKLGAFNYLQKPLNLDELRLCIDQALEFRRLNQKVEYLSEELEMRNRYGNMVGCSPPMQKIYKLIDKLKDVDTNVMITGESGTGKELVARAIHYAGLRKNGPFVTVNCAAIPSGLLESELFGHKKGAFTGAIADNGGRLLAADGGTFFFDEISEMPLELQSKILRVIQEREVQPVGGEKYQSLNVRFVAATNRNLWESVQQGTFRSDLYYRLQVIEVKMPPLRERKQDIPILCEQFINRSAKSKGRQVPTITRRAEKLLIEYTYPGNVRELINAIEYAMVLCEDNVIDVDDLPANIRMGAEPSQNQRAPEQAIESYLKSRSIRDVECEMIKLALADKLLTKRQIADRLGISERTLFYKMREYEL